MARQSPNLRGDTARARARQAMLLEVGHRVLADLLMESAYPGEQVLERLDAALGTHLVMGIPAGLGPDLDDALFEALLRATNLKAPKRRQRTRAIDPRPRGPRDPRLPRTPPPRVP